MQRHSEGGEAAGDLHRVVDVITGITRREDASRCGRQRGRPGERGVVAVRERDRRPVGGEAGDAAERVERRRHRKTRSGRDVGDEHASCSAGARRLGPDNPTPADEERSLRMSVAYDPVPVPQEVVDVHVRNALRARALGPGRVPAAHVGVSERALPELPDGLRSAAPICRARPLRASQAQTVKSPGSDSECSSSQTSQRPPKVPTAWSFLASGNLRTRVYRLVLASTFTTPENRAE
jgi:hypothetical protein